MEIVERKIVAAYVVSADNKLLLGRKDPARGGVYLDCWHTPGGGIEPGENTEQSLQREVLEETGMDITNAQKILVDNQGESETIQRKPGEPEKLIKMTFCIYKVVIAKNATDILLKPADDLIDLTWFDIQQLNELKMTPPSDALFARIGTSWLEN